MRDLLVTFLVLGSLPFILRHAYLGIYVWSWLSYMNPQRLAYGFAQSTPYAQIVAITLLISLLFTKDRKPLPRDKTVVVWVIYLLWMTLTTFFALQPEAAWEGFNTVMKIQFITFLTMILITDQRRIDLLIWTIVLSIGFYSFKGGIFTLIHGGHYRVYGPIKSYIEENNALGLASLMIVPLAYYLYYITGNRLLKWGVGLFIFLTIVSVLGSQSRGALVAVLAVGGFFWLKSSRKLVSGIAIAVFVLIGFSIMSDTWFDRMETIRNYEQDASAMARLNAWTYNFNVAADRIMGAGFRSESAATFAIYAPNPDDVHAAHSIFFGVLGDHGWIGLAFFLTILFFTWRSLVYVIRHTKDSTDEGDAGKNLLARMLQVSLIAYASGGAFLGLAYFDLPWHIIAISILLRNQLQVHVSPNSDPVEQPDRPERGLLATRSRVGLRQQGM